MNKILLFCISIIIVLLISGCGNEPQVIAREFLTAMEKHDFTNAAQYVEKNSQPILQAIKARYDSMSTNERQASLNRKYKITKTVIEEKTEWAFIYYTEKNDSDKGQITMKNSTPNELRLMNMGDGNWKVIIDHYHKF